MSKPPTRGARIVHRLLIAVIAWGVFAFGAVYPWAYWPVVVTATAVAVASIIIARGANNPPLHLRALAIAFGCFIGAVAVQLIPLPLSLVAQLSPASMRLLQDYYPSIGAGLVTRHSLSIQPGLTLTAAVLIGCWMLLAIGCARLLSVTGARPLLEVLTILGATVGLMAIIQAPLYTGKIYGFWTPMAVQSTPFGPFVNKNHFGGCMLMLLPVAIGVFIEGVSAAMRGVRPRWRNRLLWFASPQANRLLLVGASIVLMTLAVVLSMSRSAIIAAALISSVAALVALRQQEGRVRKVVIMSLLVVTMFVSVAWAGLDTLKTRFTKDGGSGANRLIAWADACGVIGDFPLTGSGLNTYTVAMLFYQRQGLSHHYAQAHNDYLQLVAEGGILLGVPAACCVLAFAVAVRRRFAEDVAMHAYWPRTAALMGILAVATQELLDFSLQMPGNAALFATLCGVALHRSPTLGRRNHGTS